MKKYLIISTVLLTALGLASFIPKGGPALGAASVVSIGKNGSSQYLLYPTDSLSANNFIATSTTGTSTFLGNVVITRRTVIGTPTITPNIPVLVETNEPSNGYTSVALKNTASDGRAQMTFSAGAQDYYEGFIGMSGTTVTNATSTMELGCGSSLCKLNFWAGGQERARFGESGYFSIATTSTQLFPLHVAQEALAAMFGKLENVSTYIGLTYNRAAGYPRAFFGYNAGTGNAVVQGGLAKGIEFNVNNNTFTSGTAMTITSGANVGVATTSPWRKFSVVGTMAVNGLTTSTAGNAVCILASFDVVTAGNTTCITSSLKTKKDISPILSGDEIMKLRPVEYTNIEKGDRRYGFIAEEVEEVDKNLVEYASEDKTFMLDGKKVEIKKGEPSGFDYLRYTALLTKKVQDMQHQIDGNTPVKSVQDKVQWTFIALLFAGLAYQQSQIIKLKK